MQSPLGPTGKPAGRRAATWVRIGSRESTWIGSETTLAMPIAIAGRQESVVHGAHQAKEPTAPASLGCSLG